VPAGTTTGGQLLTDVRAGTLPNVGMLIPNICNDAHNCTLATADDWLKSWLPTIMSGPDFTTGRLAIVVTADEDDRKSGNTVLTTVVSRSLDGAHKVVSTPLTHYSLSAWLSRLAGGTPLREGASAPDLKAAFGF
jgi:acid phosphatase